MPHGTQVGLIYNIQPSNQSKPFYTETPHSNLMEKVDREQVAKVNLHLAKVLRRRQKESGNSSIKIHQDKEYSENPMERVDVEETLTVKEDGIKVPSIVVVQNLLSQIPNSKTLTNISGPGKCICLLSREMQC